MVILHDGIIAYQSFHKTFFVTGRWIAEYCCKTVMRGQGRICILHSGMSTKVILYRNFPMIKK